MTSVQIYRIKGGGYRAFSCLGHTGYAESGEDIVCAGVTAIVFNTINCLTDLLGEDISLEMDEDAGKVICNFNAEPSEKANFLVDCMIHGLEWIQGQYGSEYLRYEINELAQEPARAN